jgi:Protein of unknown function (DUF2950)
MNRRIYINSATWNQALSKLLLAVGVIALLGLLFVSLSLDSAGAQTATKSATTPAAKQRAFATPQQAADAFIDAAEKFDVAALDAILGPDGRDIIHTGEPALDKEQSVAFAAKAREKKNVSVDRKAANRAFLSVGQDDWPFPVPIVNRGGKWSFDSKAGRQEILYRRIGRNELDVIEICRGFVEAQHEYALMKHDGSGVNQYAQRVISTPGKQDGLAWQLGDGRWGGPVGEKVAQAIARGYTGKGEPFHGYFFKVLKGQGPAAPLGRMDFLVKGVMIGGFAVVASPAEYGVTGVKSFMVSHDGVVYEKDLGPDTLSAFRKMELFNPDNTWSPVKEP